MALTNTNQILKLLDAVTGASVGSAVPVVNRRIGQNHSAVIAIDTAGTYTLEVQGRYENSGNWITLATRTEADDPVFEVVPAPEMRISQSASSAAVTAYLQK